MLPLTTLDAMRIQNPLQRHPLHLLLQRILHRDHGPGISREVFHLTIRRIVDNVLFQLLGGSDFELDGSSMGSAGLEEDVFILVIDALLEVWRTEDFEDLDVHALGHLKRVPLV